MGEDKNHKIMAALVDQLTDAGVNKKAVCAKLKRARNADSKTALLLEIRAWEKREARWQDEIAFRKTMNF